ncbi:MAG: acyl carrier protein [Desulfuromonadales bacterium]|nr:acyl carrier protein [Desulfuromonadales bacterium]
MTDQQIIERINTSLAEEFELDLQDMTSEANLFTDLGLDSLDLVDLVIVLEGAFGFKIREQETVRQIRTLEDIHRFVIDKKRSLERTA